MNEHCIKLFVDQNSYNGTEQLKDIGPIGIHTINNEGNLAVFELKYRGIIKAIRQLALKTTLI